MDLAAGARGRHERSSCPHLPLTALSAVPVVGRRSQRFPKLALVGFGLTLLFVVITIAAALVAQLRYDAELANVDWLHGGAEAFEP